VGRPRQRPQREGPRLGPLPPRHRLPAPDARTSLLA